MIICRAFRNPQWKARRNALQSGKYYKAQTPNITEKALVKKDTYSASTYLDY